MVLADAHDEPVHLIEYLHEGRSRFGAHRRGNVRGAANPGFELWPLADRKARLFARQWLECALKQFADLFIVCIRRQYLMSFQNAPGVSVHNENRMIAGIEEYGVRCLGAYSIEIQKFGAELIRRFREQIVERSRMVRIQKFDEGLQPPCFLPEITGWPDQLLELAQRSRPDPVDGENSCVPQIAQRSLDIGP